VTIPNANCWGLTLGYEPWGNLLQSSTTGPSGCSEPAPLSVTVNPSNTIAYNTFANQIANYCYDSAGNLIFIAQPAASPGSPCPTSGPYQYVYDAENHLISTASVTYTYDGDGNRVEKSNGKLYWYGANIDPLDETDLAGNTNNTSFEEYIFFGATRVARRDYLNDVDYYFADHLGTARVVTNSAGTILDDSDFYPFGGERPVTSSSGNTYKFTSKERDSESGLDNFVARYNSSNLGRFMSPDPDNAGASLGAPQSWNAYSYVLNNPLKYIDPSGMDCIYLNDAGDSVDHIIHGDCTSDTDGGYFVDNDQNHPVQKSDVTITGDANFMIVSFASQNDVPGLGHYQQFCIGSCPGNSVTVSAGLLDPIPTTMTHTPVGLMPTKLSAQQLAQKAGFDFWNMTPLQQSKLSSCLELVPPDLLDESGPLPSDSVPEAEGQKEVYVPGVADRSKKPMVANPTGANSAVRVGTNSSIFSQLADAVTCAGKAATNQ
jgi:RHS repeat-associated protein